MKNLKSPAKTSATVYKTWKRVVSQVLETRGEKCIPSSKKMSQKIQVKTIQEVWDTTKRQKSMNNGNRGEET